MQNFLELASTRRSIRKFTEQSIPAGDVEYMIRAAVHAPSGCNSQCWKFVAVTDKSVIAQMEQAVADKVADLLALKKNELTEEYLSAKKKMATFFTKAPVVVGVFMTEAEFYDQTFVSALKDQGIDDEGFMKLMGHFDLLSIGAAVQNLLLAAHEKGYGACWMNEPAIAGEAINRILGVSPEARLLSLIPIGHPAYMPREKTMKDWDEVYKFV